MTQNKRYEKTFTLTLSATAYWSDNERQNAEWLRQNFERMIAKNVPTLVVGEAEVIYSKEVPL